MLETILVIFILLTGYIAVTNKIARWKRDKNFVRDWRRWEEEQNRKAD